MSDQLERLSRSNAPTCSRFDAAAAADYLARAIMSPPSWRPNDRVQRIALKGGNYPDKETDLGGLCLKALAKTIEKAILDRPRFFGENADVEARQERL